MKIKSLIYSALIALGVMFFSSCDDVDDEDIVESNLQVKFINEASSVVTIVSIELLPMGKAGKKNDPLTENWSANILPAGTKIAPGAHAMFNLKIPNLEWSKYQIGVEDGDGNTIRLHEQAVPVTDELPITHWGSDDRTVSVLVSFNSQTQCYYIQGWIDFAGIE